MFMAFKRKEMKASRRLAENDIITRGVNSQNPADGITKIRLTMPRVKKSRADRNPWLAKMIKTQITDIILRRVNGHPSPGTQSQNIEKQKSFQVIDSVKFGNIKTLKHWRMLTRVLFQIFHLPKYSIIFCVLF